MLLLVSMFSVSFNMEELKEMLDLNDFSVGLFLIHLLSYTEKNNMTTVQFRVAELYNDFNKIFDDPKYQEWSTSAPYLEKRLQKTLEKNR